MPTRVSRHAVIASRILIVLLAMGRSGIAAEEGGKQHDLRMRHPTRAPSAFYCGIDSLYVCCRQADPAFAVELIGLEQKAKRVPGGVSAAELVRVARQFDVEVEAVQTSLETLLFWGEPTVLHVNDSHFVALLGTDASRLLIFDPAIGLFDCTKDTFLHRYDWSGVGLVVGGIPPASVRFFASSLFVPCVLFSMVFVYVVARVRQTVMRREPTDNAQDVQSSVP